MRSYRIVGAAIVVLVESRMTKVVATIERNIARCRGRSGPFSTGLLVVKSSANLACQRLRVLVISSRPSRPLSTQLSKLVEGLEKKAK